jgi:hypothetical protein
MKVTRRTPRTQLVTDVIRVKAVELEPELAEEIGLDDGYIRLAISQFAKLSTRMIVENGEVDFELARGNDTPAQLRSKFVAYLNSMCLPIIEAALGEIDEMDKPYDPALAPEEPPEDADPK